ncbi:MAG: hypothetical protein EZS28_014941 [Streblomastix strix]|uniref:Uncharacterized protein n=1 Tax=Streblomastix strix TaxID=222440 RepID=A0A5J4W3N7_9EUKA|nr:MAG: hypothetical protein EZS28_014941 [Streblomastix strix]
MIEILKKKRENCVLQEKEQELYELWLQHDKTRQIQRDCFRSQCKSLQEQEAVVIYDFKQDITLPLDHQQPQQDFYHSKQVQIFGVVIVFRRKGSQKIEKKYLIYISELLRKDFITVTDCIKHAFSIEPLKSCRVVNTWSDGAPVMKCGFVMWLLLDTGSPLRKDGMEIFMNSYCESHGKNFVDSLLGMIQNYLKSKRLTTPIKSYQQLLQNLRESFIIQKKDGTYCETAIIDYTRVPGYCRLRRFNVVDFSRFLHFETNHLNLLGSFNSFSSSKKIIMRKDEQRGWVEVTVKYAPEDKRKHKDEIFGPYQANKQLKRMEKDE